MKRLTVQVLDEQGRTIFIGTPGLEDEYINIEQLVGQPTSLSCKVSDLSAVLEKAAVKPLADLIGSHDPEEEAKKPLRARSRRVVLSQPMGEPEEPMHASANEAPR